MINFEVNNLPSVRIADLFPNPLGTFNTVVDCFGHAMIAVKMASFGWLPWAFYHAAALEMFQSIQIDTGPGLGDSSRFESIVFQEII